MITTRHIIEFARWFEEISPGFLVSVIAAETGEDYRDRDVLDQMACLIEINGLLPAAEIVGGH